MTSLVPVMMIAVTIMWLNEDNGLKIAWRINNFDGESLLLHRRYLKGNCTMCKLDEGARLDMMYLDYSTIAIDT